LGQSCSSTDAFHQKSAIATVCVRYFSVFFKNFVIQFVVCRAIVYNRTWVIAVMEHLAWTNYFLATLIRTCTNLYILVPTPVNLRWWVCVFPMPCSEENERKESPRHWRYIDVQCFLIRNIGRNYPHHSNQMICKVMP
jgi:hypothetical protein